MAETTTSSPTPDLFLTDEEQRRQQQTPLMRQYWKIKDRHPGALLLFRMGDFYETFEDDAEVLSDVLGITLTSRGNGAAEEVPLAGFPHHALEQHLPKLVRAGYRVAICEQLEDPKQAKKVVKRGVVEVVTPGVVLQDSLLSPKQATYLTSIHFGKGRDAGSVGVAFVDVSTGEFFVSEIDAAALPSMIQSIDPAEVIVDKHERSNLDVLREPALAEAGGESYPFLVTPQEDWVFDAEFAAETMLRHFRTHSLKGFGIEELELGTVAAGAALHYLRENQKGRLGHIRNVRRFDVGETLALDRETKRNLELTTSLTEGGREGSLIQILDATRTSMGGRLLRSWLVRPLRRVEAIRRRLDAVEALADQRSLREDLSKQLGRIGDLERLTGRACTGRASPRDLGALRRSLEQIPGVKSVLEDVSVDLLGSLQEALDPCTNLVSLLGKALVDEPPARIDTGGIIRDGYNEELDELRSVASGGRDYLDGLRDRERERTGISSLKIGFNKVFGYYIEITNTHKEKVPEDYIRKQTLTNAERYITPELKEYEEKILTAEERLTEIEYRLFNELREAVAKEVDALQSNAGALATLDVLLSFAEVAKRNDYTKPEVDGSTVLEIEEGRHPVVEKSLAAGEAFVPNDVRIAGGEASEADELGQIHVITGPNMAGKSVALRQTGLIVLLAQVGSFVPAMKARVGVVDALFTRVGASDNLAAGESTFLVEMNETARILNNATPRSLVLLDEVGRGTSTFDGLSIAWALVEYLHDTPERWARTLFATHYHELAELADRLERVRPFRIQVQEHGDRVLFLHRLVPGSADHSYGIEVARMAGLPQQVVQRAKAVLRHLEEHDVASEVGTGAEAGIKNPSLEGGGSARRAESEGVGPKRGTSRAAVGTVPDAEAPTLPPELPEEWIRVRDRLASLDPDRLTPVEALMALADLKKLAD